MVLRGEWFEGRGSKAYSTLLSKPVDWRPSINALDFKVLGALDAKWLEEPFLEEEVFNALSDSNGDKAPRPDGFSLASSIFVGIL